MNDLHRIHELEALINRVAGILLQIDSAESNEAPICPRKKMTHEQIIGSFRAACKDSRKAKTSRQRKSESISKKRTAS